MTQLARFDLRGRSYCAEPCERCDVALREEGYDPQAERSRAATEGAVTFGVGAQVRGIPERTWPLCTRCGFKVNPLHLAKNCVGRREDLPCTPASAFEPAQPGVVISVMWGGPGVSYKVLWLLRDDSSLVFDAAALTPTTRVVELGATVRFPFGRELGHGEGSYVQGPVVQIVDDTVFLETELWAHNWKAQRDLALQPFKRPGVERSRLVVLESAEERRERTAREKGGWL